MAGAVRSAGILPYRVRGDGLEVFIAHMGGPFWQRRDEAGWSIVKGEFLPDSETARDAAVREFAEEIGTAPDGELVELGEFRQPSGKIITVFILEHGSMPLAFVGSNTFELEWPKGSGRMRAFPEVDRAQWWGLDDASTKLVKGQRTILQALTLAVRGDVPEPRDG